MKGCISALLSSNYGTAKQGKNESSMIKKCKTIVAALFTGVLDGNIYCTWLDKRTKYTVPLYSMGANTATDFT